MQIFNKFCLKIILSLVLVAGAVASAQAAAPACKPASLATLYPGLAGKTISIGQDGESPPFSMRDPSDFSRLVGLDTDMARAVFKCIGVPVTFKTGSWSGLIPATMSGQINVMWDQLLYTPERAKKLDFIAYMNSATGALVANGNPKHLTSMDALCGVTATALLGTTQEMMLHAQSASCTNAGKAPINVVVSADIPSGLRLVQSGRADILLGNTFVIHQMAAANPGSTAVGFSVMTGAKLAAGTAKGNPDLVKAIRDGLVAIRSDGTEQRIFEKYHVDYSLAITPTVLSQ
jgi:polar amino acid transport system substrate-binding protein